MTPLTVTPPPAAKSPAAAGPQPYRWTIDGSSDVALTGLVRDMKTRLIHGEVYTMVMPSPPHDVALSLTYEFLRAACPPGHYVRNQQGFDIGVRNDPGPDLAVVPGSVRDYATRTPTAAVMVVEVADSSLAMDTTTKAELYATAGVPEYWVIDLNGRQLLVFRDPAPLPAGLGATAYATRLTFGPADRVAPLAAPNASVAVADLLP